MHDVAAILDAGHLEGRRAIESSPVLRTEDEEDGGAVRDREAISFELAALARLDREAGAFELDTVLSQREVRGEASAYVSRVDEPRGLMAVEERLTDCERDFAE